MIHHRQIGNDGQVLALGSQGGTAWRKNIVKLSDRSHGRAVVEIHVLDDQNRILANQGSIHEAHVINGGRRRDNAPSGRGGKNAGRIHQVLRSITTAHGDFGAQHKRNRVVTTKHMPGLSNLVKDLVTCDPHEIGIHELDDWLVAAVHGQPAPQSRECTLTNGRA